MFRGLFEGPGIWIVLAVVLLLFGATRLPALARSIGQSTKIFREEMKTDKPADAAAPSTPAAAAPMTVAEPVAPPAATTTAAEPAAPTKPAKSSKAASGKSGKTAKS
ncbi:MAG TPA: twin-arginine translocase TatA/TatE family subunit [Pseudolysinimonas sp.]|jgi:sec-independent protein translocase protein TatA